jgi:hypothetical protein
MDPVFAAEPTILGLVGAFCSVLGISMGILSHISTRKSAAEEASRKCHEDLLAEQRRTERLSAELQKLRLKYGESDE